MVSSCGPSVLAGIFVFSVVRVAERATSPVTDIPLVLICSLLERTVSQGTQQT